MADHYGADADIPLRRERAAIAAQACQTCRTRKSKCDEQRPRCGLCQRLDVECQYREPQPTKKDKTMVQILEALARLETKFDNISVTNSQSSTFANGGREANLPQALHDSQGHDSQRYFTDAHAVLTWPAIYVHLATTGLPAAADLPNVLQRGSAWFTHLQMSTRSFWPDPNLRLEVTSNAPRDGRSAATVTYPFLSIQQTQIYAEAYFHTFNVTHPILEQDSFVDNIATPVLRHGYTNGDVKSVIALLVYALGQLALEGTLDEPIKASHTGHSGIRGGTARDPPGLATFNEARKRLGLLSGEFSVEDIQARLLTATYLGAAGMHLDFWRTTLTASATCQVLVRSTSPEWTSESGEILKRLFWICYLNEMMCYFDLGLPLTELSQLQDIVPFPVYSDAHTNGVGSKSPEYDRSQHHYYFPAILSLERLIHEIHTSIIEPASQQAKTSAGTSSPAAPFLREMARKLDSWRSLLPRQLQWLDNEKLDFPSTEIGIRRLSEPLFALDQGTVPIRHRHNLDVTTAHLRSRFYQARHLLYQPFLYKALHFSESLTKDDAECAALALQSALMWPILMAPPKDKKRLVPYIFTWTQSCIAMLFIFKMTKVHDQLRTVCEEQVDQSMLESTVTLMLDWIHDMRLVDPIAEWGVQLLEPLVLDGG